MKRLQWLRAFADEYRMAACEELASAQEAVYWHDQGYEPIEAVRLCLLAQRTDEVTV